jgi:hypothetical protein
MNFRVRSVTCESAMMTGWVSARSVEGAESVGL